MKIICSTSVIAGLLASSSILNMASAATPIYVRGDGNDVNCNGTVNVADSVMARPNCAVASVGLGVGLVDNNGVVDIHTGTYAIGAQVVVSKGVTLVGQGQGITVLLATVSTSSSGNGRGWFLVNSTGDLALQDLTIDGNAPIQSIYQAIRVNPGGAGSTDNVSFRNIQFAGYQGTAIVSQGLFDVTDSDFVNIGRIGVFYFGVGASGSQVSGMTYTGKGLGDHLDYGIELGGGASISITDALISQNLGVASSDGSLSAGVLATTIFGAGTALAITESSILQNRIGILLGVDESTADSTSTTIQTSELDENGIAIQSFASGGLTVEENCVTRSDSDGMFLGDDVNPTSIQDNNFVDNDDFGIRYTGVNTILATNNWWADAAGPQGPNGDGSFPDVDMGSGFVTTAPFLNVPASTVVTCSVLPVELMKWEVL